MIMAVAFLQLVLLATATATPLVRREVATMTVEAAGEITSGSEGEAVTADLRTVSASQDAAGSASVAIDSGSFVSSQDLQALDARAARLFDSISDIKFNRTSATKEELDSMVKEWQRVKTIVIKNKPKLSENDMARQVNLHAIDQMKNSKGHGHAMFTVCVGLVQNSGGADACKSLDAIGAGCPAAAKSVPTLRCDRLTRQMGIQCNMTRDAAYLKSADSFCAHLVTNAVPVDEEPPCMHFMEDVSNLVAGKDLQKGNATTHRKHWPGIIDDDLFNGSFTEECLADSPGDTVTCSRLLDGLHSAKSALPTNGKNQSLFLAALCPLIGKPLPAKYAHFGSASTMEMKTFRGGLLSLYYDAARITHGIHKSSPASAPRQSSSHYEDGPNDCCDNIAQRVSINGELSLGYSISGGFGYGSGFKRWDGDYCRWGGCNFYHYCMSVGLDIGYDIGADWENYYNYGNINGKSEVYGVTACYIICYGFGSIHNSLPAGQGPGEQIGWVHEWGGGYGGEFGFSQCDAECRQEDLPEQTVHRNNCPNNCFPARATVETPSGPKTVANLQVGEKVLAVDDMGNLFFDDVYFFGHADAAAEESFVGILLSGKSEEIQLSARHFIQICPRRRPCPWSERVHAYADAVRVGDYAFALPGTGVEGEHRPSQVVRLSSPVERGLYNPYTLSGSIVVNGVVASAHSNWVLDPWVPASWSSALPRVYQWLFLPGRWLYHLAGLPAAELLGLANPTAAPGTVQDPTAALGVVQV